MKEKPREQWSFALAQLASLIVYCFLINAFAVDALRNVNGDSLLFTLKTSTNGSSRAVHQNEHRQTGRRLLQDSLDESEIDSLRSRIAGLRLTLDRKLREKRDLERERDYLEKANELIKGQREAQHGVARLSREELEEKAREIAQFRQEIPKTIAIYDSLVRKQQEMEQSLTEMHANALRLEKARNEMLSKMSRLDMEDFIRAHAKGLPLSMAGALKKSAEIIVPFLDTISLAADTNHRLVEHVSSEIDKYTHVRVAKSPFMSGLIFYCVILIPILTIICFIRRVFDASIKLGVSHFVIFGNLYFLSICIFCIISGTTKHVDPLLLFQKTHEKGFVAFNLFLGLYFVWHIGILALQTLMNWKRGNLSQLVATACIGLHYFIFTWRRVFLNLYPTMYTHSYLVYATIFAFITYERCLRLNPKMFQDSEVILWLKGKQNLSKARFWRLCKLSFFDIIRSFTSHDKSARRREPPRTKIAAALDIDIGDTQVSPDTREAEAGIARKPRRLRDAYRQTARERRARQRRGFLQSFFGANESDSSSEDLSDFSSSDNENIKQQTTWGFSRAAPVRQTRRKRRDSSTARKAATQSWWGWGT